MLTAILKYCSTQSTHTETYTIYSTLTETYTIYSVKDFMSFYFVEGDQIKISEKYHCNQNDYLKPSFTG